MPMTQTSAEDPSQNVVRAICQSCTTVTVHSPKIKKLARTPSGGISSVLTTLLFALYFTIGCGAFCRLVRRLDR
jgi:hypothetical protein